jgi:hypothetical protein
VCPILVHGIGTGLLNSVPVLDERLTQNKSIHIVIKYDIEKISIKYKIYHPKIKINLSQTIFYKSLMF